MDRFGGIFGSKDGEDDYDVFSDDEDDSDVAADLDVPPSPVGQDERRMQVRAYNYWVGMLDDRNFPPVDKLDPEALEEFGPYAVILDFSDGIDDPAIPFLGEELAGECNTSGAIRRLSDISGRSLLSRITDHYMQILANQAPIGFEAEFVNERGHAVLYRGILLPYSRDDETIDTILGVINWKELADQQTADELLLEIEQALEAGREPSEPDTLDLAADWAEDEDDEVGVAEVETELEAEAEAEAEPELADAIDWNAEGSPLCRRGAPRGDAPEMPDDYDDEIGADWSDAEEPIYAVDYGAQGLEDGEDCDDVEDVVDPLADENVGQGLSFLVSRGERRKPIVDLSALGSPEADEPDDAGPAIPKAYQPEADAAPFTRAPVTVPQPIFEAEAAEDFAESPDLHDETESFEPSADEDLYDTLAAARELAELVRSGEQRTRSALYRAIGRAYDFSAIAAEEPEGFAELLADNGLKRQDRAPMTPVVKLVFGCDYDKTRLTEYAAVLSYAQRLGLETGSLAEFLEGSEGGIKGIVKAERAARRAESGKPSARAEGLKPAVTRKLRGIESVELADIAAAGPEFALVMVRRTEDGELRVLGEIAEDVKLIERAGRKLIG